MPDTLKPREAKEVEDAVAWAIAEGKPLEIAGRGSKRALGRPNQSDLTLDLSGLSGVTLYEPQELVLSARAGTPIAEVEKLVADNGQELAFEPMDYSALLGVARAGGTLGGVVAANLSGPRRIKAGAARDHFLGFTAVSGRGETFKSGGRVVKNVTGYDLCKVMAGSFGTLGAMTDITIKTLPAAESEETLIVRGLDDTAAAGAMARAMGSSCDVSGAGHIPGNLARRFSSLPGPKSATAFRLEGVAPSVAHRKDMLAALLKDFGAAELLERGASKIFWQSMRDVLPFAADGPSKERVIWRVSTAPSRGHELAETLSTSAEMIYDWAGGLIWLAVLPSDDGGASAIRRAVSAIGGHATLIRAPAAIRAKVDVFQPQDSGNAALSRRLKESFDPKGILNPGRMWAGV
jgi:glycolate oxidase FAD binding subunit